MYIDLEKAQELIAAAIAEKGADYVYPNSGVDASNCSYVDEVDGKFVPGCIVGNAMINGVGVDMRGILEDQVNRDSASEFLAWARDAGYIEGYSVDADIYLGNLQMSQDLGRPWGEAELNARDQKSWSRELEKYV